MTYASMASSRERQTFRMRSASYVFWTPLFCTNLRPHIGQKGHGVSLGLQGFMDMTALKKGIDHFPPACGGIAADTFLDNEFMQFRHRVGLVEPGMIAVGKFFVGEVNGPAYQARHTVRRSRDIQRRGQQRQ